MKKYFGLLFFLLFTFIGLAIAQDVVPAPDLGLSVLALLDAFKGGAVPATIVVAVMQLLKTKLFGNLIGKLHSGAVPLLVLVLGLVSGVLQDVGEGKSWFESAIKGLFNGGYAMLIYAVVIKHFVKKKT